MRSLSLAGGFGLEVGLTMDVDVAGGRIIEIPLELSHTPTDRGIRGILHRAGQLRDLMRASASRLGWRCTLESTLRAAIRRIKQ